MTLPDGTRGAHPDTQVDGFGDDVYGTRTHVAQSRTGVRLPSEAFMDAETITAGEWQRRHAGTYQTAVAVGGTTHSSTPPPGGQSSRDHDLDRSGMGQDGQGTPAVATGTRSAA